MTYVQAKRKLFIERIFIYPFVLLGKLIGWLFPLKTSHGVFLFFSSADIGGAPKVNADIANCIRDKKPLIIFSKKPKNNEFSSLFDIDGVRVIDLHKLIDNKIYHFINVIYRGIIASWIHRQKTKPIVFGGECIYFYKIIPHIKRHVKCVELCHLDTWMPYSIGFIDEIDMRVFSTRTIKKKVEDQYRENDLPGFYFNRLFFIDNYIDIPSYEPIDNDILQVIFIGRGAPQKRVHLIAAIAKQMHLSGDKAHFSFVGDVENIVNPEEYPYCTFYGNIKSQEKLNSLYKLSDVLLLTSAYEGLPIVVMQMMAYGRVVVSTATDGIPEYIKNNENGLIITATKEEEIVQQGIFQLRKLIADKDMRHRLGRKSRQLAISLFSKEEFCKNYNEILT